MKIYMHKLKLTLRTQNSFYKYKVPKIHQPNTSVKLQMFRWMLPQGDLWKACEHGGVQMDAAIKGHLAACEHIP